jgi:hypothetical protein
MHSGKRNTKERFQNVLNYAEHVSNYFCHATLIYPAVRAYRKESELFEQLQSIINDVNVTGNYILDKREYKAISDAYMEIDKFLRANN